MVPETEERGEKGAVLRVNVAAKLADSDEEDIKRQVTVCHMFSYRVVYRAPRKERSCSVDLGTPRTCL